MKLEELQKIVERNDADICCSFRNHAEEIMDVLRAAKAFLKFDQEYMGFVYDGKNEREELIAALKALEEK